MHISFNTAFNEFDEKKSDACMSQPATSNQATTNNNNTKNYVRSHVAIKIMSGH